MADNSTNLNENVASEELAFEHYIQTAKVTSTILVTEDGVYKPDELPEDYGGSVIEIEALHAVYLSNRTGSTIKLEFEVPEALDKDGKTGGAYTLDGVAVKEASEGGSEVPTEMITVKRATVSEEMAKARDYLLTNYDKWDYF